jgi:hypothetical protein
MIKATAHHAILIPMANPPLEFSGINSLEHRPIRQSDPTKKLKPLG